MIEAARLMLIGERMLAAARSLDATPDELLAVTTSIALNVGEVTGRILSVKPTPANVVIFPGERRARAGHLVSPRDGSTPSIPTLGSVPDATENTMGRVSDTDAARGVTS